MYEDLVLCHLAGSELVISNHRRIVYYFDIFVVHCICYPFLNPNLDTTCA